MERGREGEGGHSLSFTLSDDPFMEGKIDSSARHQVKPCRCTMCAGGSPKTSGAAHGPVGHHSQPCSAL